MNQLTEALQSLMAPQGATLDVPHPADIKKVSITALTGWHPSELKSDWHKEEDGDWNKTVVQGRLAMALNLDDYDEPIGEATLILQHKYGHPTRQSKDISTTNVSAHEVKKLKARFPAAFAEYELKLARERAPVPLALLDSVPPEVVQVIQTLGARTVQDFAAFGDEAMEKLTAKLESNNMAARLAFVPAYRDRAREMTGWQPSEAEPPATRRPQRQAAA